MQNLFKIIRPVVLFIFLSCLSAEIKGIDAGRIAEAIDSIAKEHNIPSVAYAIVNSDRIIVSGASGYASIENGIPATSHTVYRVGSLSKTFIALGILNLVYEGKLRLDDPLSKITPELQVENRWEERSPVLLRHLLEHTAGFRDLYLRDFILPEDTPLPDVTESVMREPRYLVSRWEPGTRNAYSNPGYTILGYIIQKYSGMSYDSYIKEILFDPLDMHNSDFLGSDHSNLAVSYNKNGNPQTPLPIFDHPAGYLHTTPDDMAKFLRFMLLSGQTEFVNFMTPDWFRLMERPSSIIGADYEMVGYGLGLYGTIVKGHLGFGHDGGINEYISSFACFRDPGVAYYFTVTTMDGNFSQELSRYLHDLLLTERMIFTSNFLEDTDIIEGWYIPKSYRMALVRMLNDLFDPVRLRVEDDTLRLISFGGEKTDLISLTRGYYRTEGSPVATHFIGEYGNKIVISSSYGHAGGYFEKTTSFRALWKTWGFIISHLVFILVAVVYFVNYLVARIKKLEVNPKPMIWPATGLLFFIIMLIMLIRLTSVAFLGTVNIFSVAVAIFSGLYALCFAFGILSFRKGKTHKAGWKSIPLYLGYTAWAFILILMASYGHMPVTTWIW